VAVRLARRCPGHFAFCDFFVSLVYFVVQSLQISSHAHFNEIPGWLEHVNAAQAKAQFELHNLFSNRPLKAFQAVADTF